MLLIGQEHVKPTPHSIIEHPVDRGARRKVGRVHRLGRHALDHGHARYDDAPLAHVRDQQAEQELRVRDAGRPLGQPALQFAAQRAVQVAEAVPAFDGRELLIPALPPAREAGDVRGVNAELVGDVLEHGRRDHLTAAEMPARVAQRAELERVTEARLSGASGRDARQLLCIERVDADHRFLVGWQRQERYTLPLGHRHARGHV